MGQTLSGIGRIRFYGIILVLFVLPFALRGQTGITGKVVDESGEPVVGATVSIKQSAEGTATNADGAFRLATKKAFPVNVLVNYLGYKPQEIIVSDASAPLLVTLRENINTLDEVVVTAGGIFRARREQGYATVKITDSELGAGKSPSLAGGLTAKIPGLQVNAISSGVNPNYRLVLRGNRSITGNNQALIVVDNAIVSNEFLNNINPRDIDNIQVLNGAAGSALYGSEASNGVLLITTKTGVKGKPQVRVSNTTTLEQVSFFPKLQTRFGQGKTADAQVFDQVENQQYGPAFDGTEKPLGYPLANEEQQYSLYSPAENGRNSFWETGLQNTSDVSVSFGNDRITSFVSAQYLTATGITPGDAYDKISLRLNNTQEIGRRLSVSYNVGYVENNYDITSNTNRIYSELTQISANVPITNYKDWQSDKWSYPEGWYNPWYRNPYWTAANYREETKDTYLTGKVDVKYNITPWLHVLYRIAVANRYYQSHQYGPKLTYSDYARVEQTKSNLPGYVFDRAYNKYRTNQDFQIALNKEVKDFSLNLTLGASNVNNNSKSLLVAATGLVVPELYHISNRSGDANIPTTSAAVSTTMAAIPDDPNALIRSRNYGLWGDFVIGYRNYLYLHLTGRNDWTSLLTKANRSYFYPSADLSLIVTDAIASLKDNDVVDYLKIRGAWSQVGNVNIDPYSLNPTYSSSVGYSNGTFFRESNRQILELKPEITSGYEAGTEFRLFKGLAEVQATFYHTNTTGQAIQASIAPSSGYSALLLNAGEVTNTGVETSLRLNPIRSKNWDLHIGGNYTYNRNLLKKLYPGLPRIGVNGSSVIYAVEGEEINQIFVSDYARVPEKEADGTPNPQELVGKVIIDPLTGYPSRAVESKLLGNTTPKHRLGIDLSLRWKQFTLSSVFEYRGGYYFAAHNIGSSLDFSGASARTAYYNRERFVFPNSVYKDSETGQYVENTNITVSDGGSGFWTNATYNRTGAYSNYVYSGDYWKWRELSFSYQLPPAFVRRLSGNAVQDVTLSLQGRNLLLLTPASNEFTDPDYSANDNNATGVTSLDQTPPTRYFGGTVSFTF
jgi:TonB-linked SusC/RagA family outer membrane protein